RNTALIRDSLTLGLWYEGPFASRAHDRAELAVARYAFNDRLARYQRLLNTTAAGPVGVQGAETDLILQYNVALTACCTLSPNLQYVIHPNGLHGVDNAFVVGLQAIVTF
ncbi:MAG: carbohydrate porin, partial [Pseudomonadota bacterium]|nr:carbohydrate porin [Pseudomonadota bacterium]